MSNFSFLKENKDYEDFASACVDAEKLFCFYPVFCAFACRRALDLIVKWVYDVEGLLMPEQNNLQNLVRNKEFYYLMPFSTWKMTQGIIKLGNSAAHTGTKMDQYDVRISLKGLFDFVQWVDRKYGKNYVQRQFDVNLIPRERVKIDDTKIQELTGQLGEQKKENDDLKFQNAYLKEKLAEYEEIIDKLQKNNTPVVINPITEAETRKYYIDLDLQLMGWRLGAGGNVATEFPVEGMAGVDGQTGRVDYVLFGDDGKPLAVVESKRTSKDAEAGKQQAKLYADCLEKRYGRRPFIFYTNGFDTYFWDDLNNAPRHVFCIFSKGNLERKMEQRVEHKPLNSIAINGKITERAYQAAAIRAVCEGIEAHKRKFLLVMATGTGKTRTAVSLADVLSRGDYVTNILFLADRKELVKQANDAFKDFLPNFTRCNLLKNKQDKNARVVFSTYQTILNAIDNDKDGNGEVLFTPGHFDLIFIDEAHRSIFKKYRTIFNYFDSLLVGLTATPRDDVDKNTYDFFDLPQQMPTYVYSYEQALEEKYLVPYHTIEITTEFLNEGIDYGKLTPEEKEKYEIDFWDGEKIPDHIPAEKINKYIFNSDTVDKVLQELMTNGIKVQDGNMIGKTIIFAQNKKHAQFIVDRFNVLYPQFKGKVISRVVCDDAYVDNTIETFKYKDDIQVAVSVDMLDTGVDVPEVVNLVFFKKVYSKIKFWQMIGRGTRLCKDLCCTDGSGFNQDKKYFYIFDWLGNFEFFRENPEGLKASESKSLNEMIFSRRVQLIKLLQNVNYAEEQYQNLRSKLVKIVLEQIKGLNGNLVTVKERRECIVKFKNEQAFQSLSDADVKELEDKIAPLVFSTDPDIYALQFDNLMYSMMLSPKKTNKSSAPYGSVTLKKQARKLLEKMTIPEIQSKKGIIEKIAGGSIFEGADLLVYENIRQELRGLIRYLVDTENHRIYTDLLDVVIGRVEDGGTITPPDKFVGYKEKVDAYIMNNLDNIAINKLRKNLPLTEMDLKNLEDVFMKELGTQEDYNKTFGEDTPIGVLVRQVAEMDRDAANQAFFDFINDYQLNTEQIEFVNKVVNYLVKNGKLEIGDLGKAPFDSPYKFNVLFDGEKLRKLVKVIEGVNENTEPVKVCWDRNHKNIRYANPEPKVSRVAEEEDNSYGRK